MTGRPRGRPKGSPNRNNMTLSMYKKSTGYDAYSDLIGLRNKKDCSDERKIQIAQILLPYDRPKLTAVTVSSNPDSPIVFSLHPEIQELVSGLIS